MNRHELFELTKRLRRAMPRHVELLSLCDEAERLAVAGEPVRKGPKRDRAAYMRDWRAGQKKSSGAAAGA